MRPRYASATFACLVLAACTHNVNVALTPAYEAAAWNDSAIATVRCMCTGSPKPPAASSHASS